MLTGRLGREENPKHHQNFWNSSRLRPDPPSPLGSASQAVCSVTKPSESRFLSRTVLRVLTREASQRGWHLNHNMLKECFRVTAVPRLCQAERVPGKGVIITCLGRRGVGVGVGKILKGPMCLEQSLDPSIHPSSIHLSTHPTNLALCAPGTAVNTSQRTNSTLLYQPGEVGTIISPRYR